MLLWLLMLVMIIVFLAWIYISNSHYTRILLKPGQAYSVSGRKYTFPNLNCKGPTYLLKEAHITELRQLLVSASGVLEEFSIDWFLTGGSLIGAYRHQAVPMPFDDDIDIGVDDVHRGTLFGTNFSKKALEHGMQVIFLKGASSKKAGRTGACVRLQLVDHFATLDIFFWKNSEIDKVCKLDGWDGPSVTPNEKEQFEFNDVYPLQKGVVVDGITVNIVANPRNVLVQQYSARVFDSIIARSTLVSHLFPFVVLEHLIWTKTPPG